MMQSLSIILSFLFLSQACSSIKTKPKKQTSLDQVVQELNKTDEDSNTHVLVDTIQTDDEIVKATGSDPDQVIADQDVIEEESPFLKVIKTNRVKFWIDYFAVRQRERFQRFINNGEKYRSLIEKILKEEGVPKELFYVGLIESGYYLGAHSRAKAVGPWQFIKGTGKRYGLFINQEIDERRDIEKSTRAAAHYFKDLYNIFSSWELSLAAYNAGENGIIRRMTKYQMRDYYQLCHNKKLPSETINYVPKVLAAMYLSQNHKRYGFVIPKNQDRMWVHSKRVIVNKGKSLSSLAKTLMLPKNLLVRLNPELRLEKTPRFYPGQYRIRIPSSENLEIVAQNDQEETNVNQRTRPSSLTKKQKKFQKLMLSLSQNPIKINSTLDEEAITPVKIVKAKKEKKVKNLNQKQKKHPLIVYKINKGDSLDRLSKWFNVSSKLIIRKNKLNKKMIKVGQNLTIPNTKKGTYTVKRGDHLTKIADQFKLPKILIKKLNQLHSSKIYPGQRLVVNLE